MTADTKRLVELRERVEKATGPDYELDKALWAVFDPEGYAGAARREYYSGYREHTHPPRYTASIDAALALVERVLPGWTWHIGQVPVEFRTERDRPFSCELGGPVAWEVVDRDVGEEPVFDVANGGHDTAPLAVLSALLRALAEADAGQEGGK